MVTLEVWYNQEPENDFSEGDPAILIHTPDELDALIAQMQADGKGTPVPPMAECSVSGDPMRGVFFLGIGQEKGFVLFMTPEAAQTEGDETLTGHVTYDYMAHVREIPASYEVPIAEARKVVREFLEAETLPSGQG
ncbi:Imm1 family immunity protein [Amycolatopsis sp. H20-H5]|uniref:Imm1 family immunity protein n=1 Tax=Amycolatopsis sp. H20-H5 TaxID=3046309 RepID=UPI002DB66F08|nr:Imm1 family immunity protein [Amycolatopsis sp. H20-H5]MEC3980409.1 Imm1 family immunity protein [Amycolatopsis sp. H20-H5]